MSVLVVDDEAEIRSVISALLTDEGYTVQQAATGREALLYLRTTPAFPCLIILDLMMPDINGWDFLRAQQGEPALASIPTVAISAVDTFATAAVLGVRETLLKPLDPDRLVALAQRYCGSAPS